MDVAIQIIVIICVIAGVMKKSKKDRGKQPVKEPQVSEKINQEELKSRLVQKYDSKSFERKEVKTETAPATSIFQRAFANAAEDFEKKPVLVKQQTDMQGMKEEEIIKEANQLAEIDFYSIYDVPKLPEVSQLMSIVNDILVKGVDTELSSQRDFVSEGMDMINETTA